MIERRMRVLVVTPLGEGGRGGIDRMMDEIRPYGQSADFRDLSVKFWATRGNGRGLRAAGTYLVFLIRLITVCVFRKPDVVHINLSSGGSVIRKAATCAICRAFGVPYIVHLHGSRFRQYWNASGPVVGRLIAFIFTKSDRVFVLGSVWHAFAAGKLPQIAEKLHILPNACRRGGAGEKPSAFVRLIFLGQVGERKGTFDLIEALALLPPDLRWQAVLAGDGETKRASALARQHGLQDKVQVLGWVGPDRIRTLLGSSQVLVLPSYDENLPMSVIEAMAWGLAVITTPVGAVEDIIVDGERGLLVSPGDIRTLAARLEQVISSGPMRETLGRNAHAFYEEHLNIDRYATRLRHHWIEVASDRRGTAGSDNLLLQGN
ncbi:D-inositol-3-phosphate glycosyltransferase [Methylobacterium thuringiense]|uniref:D-inositol-3-phosphate glycosyltransferase n=2 Tax=Methylobacterium thuringiense TaxID=1003091 RepID=A0ABQ4TST2_9HYPH|nr:D-inositol-3-phosphate glycosyltransferase [Methylobacterium thuringiense]